MTRRGLLALVLTLALYGTTIYLLRMNNSGNRTNSERAELNNNRRQHLSEAKKHTLNNIAKVTSSKSLSKTDQLKVLVLAYGRTGSSLTGDLISADETSAYFFEPFWWV